MTSLNDVMKFWEWFDSERGNISVLEIEKRGNAPRGRISNVYRKKKPSALVCKTIAKGLGTKQDEVFRMAGLLPTSGGKMEDLTQEEAQLVEMYRALKDQRDRESLVVVAQGFLMRQQQGE